MAKKTLPSSSGYFNAEMLAILEKDTKKPTKKTTPAKSTSKKKK